MSRSLPFCEYRLQYHTSFLGDSTSPQHHYTDVFEAGAKAMGYDTPLYRGIAVFEAESYEKIMEVFQSEEYQRVSRPDESSFLDRSKTCFCPGTIITYIDKKD